MSGDELPRYGSALVLSKPFAVPFIVLLTVLRDVAFTAKSATNKSIWLCHFCFKIPKQNGGASDSEPPEILYSLE